MKNNDWVLRLKGKHAITIFSSGEVRYSVGKKKLFTLKKDVINKLESMVKLSVNLSEDSKYDNLIRYNSDKGVIVRKNCKLYTDIWKIVYDANSVEDTPEEVTELSDLIEYIIRFGDPLSEIPLDAPDPAYLNKLLDIDIIIDSLVNLILTKENKIYYAK